MFDEAPTNGAMPYIGYSSQEYNRQEYFDGGDATKNFPTVPVLFYNCG